MNQINIIGNVGNDPELRDVNGTAVTRVSVATTERWKDKNGEKQENTTWHNCEFWGKTAEIICQYVAKGSKLRVTGLQEHRKKDDKYYASIKVRDFEFLSAKPSGDSAPKKQESFDDDLPF